MEQTEVNRGRWLDVVMLSVAGVLLAPILLVALAPVLLTFMVLWPVLMLPVVAVSRSLPVGEDRRPKQRRPRLLRLTPTRQLPQAA
ncbi:MAG: hypothetical protein IT377_06860 [Polyangiaceae bacterium]|nr:hypothetical protein [Myxococcales bacterium]MCC6898676.1 hypothetical protein [Polyangiaceae bacterium]